MGRPRVFVSLSRHPASRAAFAPALTGDVQKFDNFQNNSQCVQGRQARPVPSAPSGGKDLDGELGDGNL
jgi:hypothetical protein